MVVSQLKRLHQSEDFQAFKSEVVDPTISTLEAELASEKADDMSEVILRAKLKHLNSLKWLFDRVFKQI